MESTHSAIQLVHPSCDARMNDKLGNTLMERGVC